MSPKPKLSGAQRRKIAKQKALARQGGALAKPLSAEFLPMVKPEDLETVRDYRIGINRTLAQMFSGQISPELGTKMIYGFSQGAGLARIEQGLFEARLIRDEIMRRGKVIDQVSHLHPEVRALLEAPAVDSGLAELSGHAASPSADAEVSTVGAK
jgi:hypothetical protein